MMPLIRRVHTDEDRTCIVTLGDDTTAAAQEELRAALESGWDCIVESRRGRDASPTLHIRGGNDEPVWPEEPDRMVVWLRGYAFGKWGME